MEFRVKHTDVNLLKIFTQLKSYFSAIFFPEAQTHNEWQRKPKKKAYSKSILKIKTTKTRQA